MKIPKTKGTRQVATGRQSISPLPSRPLNKATVEIIFREPRHIPTGAGPFLDMLSWTSQLKEERVDTLGHAKLSSGQGAYVYKRRKAGMPQHVQPAQGISFSERALWECIIQDSACEGACLN